jgi:hypothetical protein
MAKSIQITRVMAANMTHLTKILAVNHKQLSNNIIDLPFLWFLQVSSVKVEPQWPKYPNLSITSFVTSKKQILEFYSVMKMVHSGKFAQSFNLHFQSIVYIKSWVCSYVVGYNILIRLQPLAGWLAAMCARWLLPAFRHHQGHSAINWESGISGKLSRIRQ